MVLASLRRLPDPGRRDVTVVYACARANLSRDPGWPCARCSPDATLGFVSAWGTSDGWQAYFNARRRFPSYSWRNVLLILSQRPTTTRVAGFRAWLDLGYCVTIRQHRDPDLGPVRSQRQADAGLAVVPEHVVHPVLLGGWWLRSLSPKEEAG